MDGKHRQRRDDAHRAGLKEAIPPRHDLLAAIGKHGGFATVAKKSGLRMSHNTKPDGYYNDITNLAREVYAFVDSEGLDGTMPTASQLKDAQQTGLTRAICSHGGFWSVAKTLGRVKQETLWLLDT